MKTLVAEEVGDIFFVANHTQDICDEDFDALLVRLREIVAEGKPARLVVRAVGSAPNPLQRARLADVAKKGEVRVAVLTDSRFVRGAIMAFGWMGSVNIRGFELNELTKALTYVETDIAVSEAQHIIAKLASLVKPA